MHRILLFTFGFFIGSFFGLLAGVGLTEGDMLRKIRQGQPIEILGNYFIATPLQFSEKYKGEKNDF